MTHAKIMTVKRAAREKWCSLRVGVRRRTVFAASKLLAWRVRYRVFRHNVTQMISDNDRLIYTATLPALLLLLLLLAYCN